MTGGKWDYAVRAGVGTALATWGGGACSLIYSMAKNKGRVDVYEVISGILASLSRFKSFKLEKCLIVKISFI